MAKVMLKAVEGRLLPLQGGNGFVGYRRALKSDVAAVEVPNGHRFVEQPIEVELTGYYRRALQRGDIAIVDKTTPKKVKE